MLSFITSNSLKLMLGSVYDARIERWMMCPGKPITVGSICSGNLCNVNGWVTGYNKGGKSAEIQKERFEKIFFYIT